jgi:hypothetical protein
VSRLIKPFVIEAGSKLERSLDKIVQTLVHTIFFNPPGPAKGEIEEVSHERAVLLRLTKLQDSRTWRVTKP